MPRTTNSRKVEKPERTARVGDSGTVRGWRSHGSIGELVIETEHEIVTVMGDWRPIRDIAEDLTGREVEVTEGEEAIFPRIRPLD